MLKLLSPFATRLTSGPSLAFSLVNSGFIFAALRMNAGAAGIGVAQWLTCLALCVVLSAGIAWAGDAALRLGGLPKIAAWLPATFVAGFVSLSLPMVALTMLAGVKPLAAFVITMAGIALLQARIASHEPALGDATWADTAAAALMALSILLLARVPIGGAGEMAVTGTLPIWSDYFLHGVTIASLGSPLVSGMDMETAGLTSGFYHYAPFILPAAFQDAFGLSGLALSTGMLLPLGLLVGVYGCYSLAAWLGNRAGALLSVAVLVAVPVFPLLMQSGWFDFYWLVFATPGSGYAIGASAVVCIGAFAWVADPAPRRLVFTIAMLLSLIMVRAHFFLLLAPAVVAVMVLGRWQAKWRCFIVGAVGLALLFIVALYASSKLHSLWIIHSNPHVYLDYALQWTWWHGRPLALPTIPSLGTALKLLIVCLAILGPYLIALPLLAWLKARQSGWTVADMFPPLLLASLVTLMLLAPTASNGDFTEYKHRHFTLVYAIAAIYAVQYAVACLPRRALGRTVWLPALATTVFVLAIGLTWRTNPSRPDVQSMPWSAKLDNQSVLPGVLGAAGYLTGKSMRGDVFASGIASSTTSDVNGVNIEIIALTGLPAYVTRAELKSGRSTCVRDTLARRLDTLRAVAASATWPDARELLRKQGVRWYLAAANDVPPWDPAGIHAAFSEPGLRIYDAGSTTSSSPFEPPRC